MRKVQKMLRAMIAVIGMAVAITVAFGLVTHLRVTRYDDVIAAAATEYGVDPRLVSALIWQESRFRPGVVGPAGEVGLMQVTEIVGYEWAGRHARPDFDVDDLLDPEVNIRAGTWYLARAMQQWSHRPDPVPYALAQYNAGRSNALRWAEGDQQDAQRFMESITYPGTRAYIERILRRYR